MYKHTFFYSTYQYRKFDPSYHELLTKHSIFINGTNEQCGNLHKTNFFATISAYKLLKLYTGCLFTFLKIQIHHFYYNVKN